MQTIVLAPLSVAMSIRGQKGVARAFQNTAATDRMAPRLSSTLERICLGAASELA